MRLNYWDLNEVYILITVVIIVIFIGSIYFLFVEFNIEISRQLNDCTNPIAIYFDTDIRNRCLTKHLSKNSDVVKLKNIDKQFKSESDTIKENINKLSQRNDITELNYNNLEKTLSTKEAPELLVAKQNFMDLSGVVSTIKTQYQENKTNLENLVNEYDRSFNTNIDLIFGIGNSLVNKLLSNIYTKKWETKRRQIVDQYNKIKTYLEKYKKKGVLRDLTNDEIFGKK
jgi:hypothetical protein